MTPQQLTQTQTSISRLEPQINLLGFFYNVVLVLTALTTIGAFFLRDPDRIMAGLAMGLVVLTAILSITIHYKNKRLSTLKDRLSTYHISLLQSELATAQSEQSAIKQSLQPRHLTAEQARIFEEELSNGTKGPIWTIVVVSDAEIVNYGKEITDILKKSGWQCKDIHPHGHGSFPDGLTVYISDPSNISAQENTVLEAFSKSGIYHVVKLGEWPLFVDQIEESRACISIGAKA